MRGPSARAWGQEQLEYRIKQLIYSYVDGTYPAEDGTDINSLYFQYLIYVNPSFDVRNPLQKRAFDIWRAEYIRRVVDAIYDPKFPILRDRYDDRWGLTLSTSRLVFTVYLSSGESQLKPYIADIGARTFLVNQKGARFQPSGTFNSYPYESDRPEGEILDGKTYYRVFFPNLKGDDKAPLVRRDDDYLELQIENLGERPIANPALGAASRVSRNAFAALADRGRGWPSARRQHGPSARREQKQ